MLLFKKLTVSDLVYKASLLYSNLKLIIAITTANFPVQSLITYLTKRYFSPPGATQPTVGVYFTALYRALASSRTRLLDHTQRRATFGRTHLNE
jgi:hypothetical protein